MGGGGLFWNVCKTNGQVTAGDLFCFMGGPLDGKILRLLSALGEDVIPEEMRQHAAKMDIDDDFLG